MHTETELGTAAAAMLSERRLNSLIVAFLLWGIA
jgi:hypothetical protein